MQDLIFHLLWGNTEIARKAHELAHEAPGYAEAFQAYQAASDRLQTIIGFDALDDYNAIVFRLQDYQSDAYYALGLGLREELAKLLIGQ